MWELTWALKNADIAVEMITCDNPGEIIYADELQVAAVPYRENDRLLKRLFN